MNRSATTAAPAPVKLAHVVFKTARFEELKEWYQTVLQARIVFENPMIAFLTYDDEHHRLALVNIPDLEPRSPQAPGLEHIAFTYRTLGDLLSTYERLKRAGIEPYWTVNHGPTTSCYYRDPDGNQVELQIDNFERTEDLHAWFRSGAFADNPIGVNFDPEKLLARFRSGVPVSELVRQETVA
jgi:catechol-2,3-dioxygenase